MPERIVVIGMDGSTPAGGAAAQAALTTADLVVGSRRHLLAAGPFEARTLVLDAELPAALEIIAEERQLVCVLASGDPGFFGIVRPLAERFGAERLEVHPAASSVAIAFARLGIPWDDAVVVTAHGRSLEAAVRRLLGASKAAILVSPENSPEALGKALVAAGGDEGKVHVCSRLGTPQESIATTDLQGLAQGCWDPLSVVVLLRAAPIASTPSLAWGLGEDLFAHRAGMITKGEVRAVVLSKLELPARGVLWDIGAGSGSVAIEVAGLSPGLNVYAVERDAKSVACIRRNAEAHSVRVRIVQGEAPAACVDLPDPDRIFVGGGGINVLEAALGRMRPGGRAVATYAAMDRATEAWFKLGNLVQLGVARGKPLDDGSLRLEANNPVFVAWGQSQIPGHDRSAESDRD